MPRLLCTIVLTYFIVCTSTLPAVTLSVSDWKNPGDQLVVLDSHTGLQWLNLTLTTNKSFSTVSGQLGSIYLGFRYATTSEVNTLFTDAGITNTTSSFSDQGNWGATSQLLNMWGITSQGPSGTYHMAQAYEYNPDEAKMWRADIAVTYPASGWYGYAWPKANGSGIDSADTRFGSALVREQPHAIISLGNAVNATIITGGMGVLGTTVSNSAVPGAANLNYTVSVAMQSGVATLGSGSPGSGSLAPGASAANTVSAVSTNIGQNTVRFTASDPQASNSPQTISTTLTVLGHSAAAFTDGSSTFSLDFGTLQVGSGTHSLQFQIKNLSAQYRAGLDLDSMVEVADTGGVFSTNAATFSNLAPNTISSFFDVFLECSTTGHFDGQYRFDLSDQKDLNGHAGTQVLTLNVTANVVPEPSTLVLLGIGAISLLAYAWRRRRRTAMFLGTLVLLAFLFFTPPATADITYHLVSYPVDQSGWNLSGFIVTDGTTGSFSYTNNNITSWQFTIANSTKSVTATSTIPGAFVSGSGWYTVSSTQITILEPHSSVQNGLELAAWASGASASLSYNNANPSFGVPNYSAAIGSTYSWYENPKMGGNHDWIIAQVTPTPEPSALVLLGIGAISLLGYAWRRRSASRVMRFRSLLFVFVAVVWSLPSIAFCQEEEETTPKQQWEQAKKTYHEQLDALKKTVVDQVMALEDKARERGDADKVKKYKEEREAFEENEELPSSASGQYEYRTKLRAAQRQLRQAFKSVQTAYLKAKIDVDAEELNKELDELLGDVETDATTSESIPASGARWVYTSYPDGRLLHVRGKQWIQANDKTKKIDWHLTEISRNRQYLLLKQKEGGNMWRVYGDHIEATHGDDKKFTWITNGHWDKKP